MSDMTDQEREDLWDDWDNEAVKMENDQSLYGEVGFEDTDIELSSSHSKRSRDMLREQKDNN